MRVRTTLLLIAVLVALGAYVYWVEYPTAQEETKKKTLVEFTAADATAVTLQYADRAIHLERSDDTWRIVRPAPFVADATTVTNLVNAIAECEVTKEVTDNPADLAPYGLDKPLVTVTVKVKDRELPPIVVGKNTPVGFATYVQRGDDKKVRLTSSAFRSGMDKQVKDLRDKTILSFADADVNRVVLRADNRTVRLAKTNESWQIEEPGPHTGDAAAVRSLLSTLRSMRANDFPSDAPSDLAQYGLDAPRLTVTLALGADNAETVLRIGKETETKELYAQTSGAPTIYTVSDWVFRDLNKSANDLRDKTVLAVNRDEMTAVAVRRKDGDAFRLVRAPDTKKWLVEGSPGQPAETVINTYLNDVRELKGYDIAADAPFDRTAFGLNDPLLTFTIEGEGGKALGTVLVAEHSGPEGSKEFTAMTEGGATVFRLREYVAHRLDKRAADFVVQPTPTAGTGTPATGAEDAAGDGSALDEEFEEADLE